MIIRRAAETDLAGIYDLVKVAFQTAQVTNGLEQDYQAQLREGDNYIPELDLVADEDGELIGHIMLTKTYITCEDNKAEALLLGPISIALPYRNRGIGTLLINESLRLAKEMGYRSVFLVGDPAYYRRFGFEPTVNYGIRDTHDGIPDEVVTVHQLVESALSGISGTVYLE
jgi:predicted N-acetyltransferase YhbS